MAAAAAFRGTVDLAAGAAGADDDDEDDAGEGQRRAVFDFANIGIATNAAAGHLPHPNIELAILKP